MRNPSRETVFRFRQFEVSNCRSAMKVGTDGVLLGAWAMHHLRGHSLGRILDVGTGTGIIALIAAQASDMAEITAIDIDEEAVAEAAGNFADSPWGNRLSATRCDICDFTADARFDLVISNPPFFTNGAMAPERQRRDARHAASLSPVSLVTAASRLLSAHGVLAMISMPQSRSAIETAVTLASMSVKHLTEVATIEGKAPRRLLWLIAAGSDAATCADRLTIRDKANTPTPEYAALVSPYYTSVK